MPLVAESAAPPRTVPERSRPRSSGLGQLRRLLPYVRPHRARLTGSMLAASGATLLGLAFPLVLRRIVDRLGSPGGDGSLLWLGGAVLLVLGLLEAGLVLARRLLIATPSSEIEYRLRMDFYGHLQRLPLGFHDGWASGQLLSRATTDLSTLRRFIAFVMVFVVVNTVTVVAGLLVLATLAPVFALIMLGFAIPLLAISLYAENAYRLLSRRSQDQIGELATAVEESVQGVRVLKALGRGGHMARLFAEQARTLRGIELRKANLLLMLWLVLLAVPGLAIAVLLWVGGQAVAAGTLSLGTVVAGVTTVTYLQWPIASLGWLMSETSEAISANQRYWQVRDAVVEVEEPARPRSLPPGRARELRFHRVSLQREDSAPLLRELDLTVPAGTTVALVGATGSGKTTLCTLAARLQDPNGGSVLLDGLDVAQLSLTQLRATVATVFEDPVLFTASVRENVAMGAPGGAVEQVSDEQVWQALRVSAADGFVAELPWGLDTRIGEQGLSLSGGQRQRMALARAMVGRPAVLVLDDPLSALDVHTEAEVEAALHGVLHEVTALVVAHRPSTVMLADSVALLQDGRITQRGTHEELMARSAAYREQMTTPGIPS